MKIDDSVVKNEKIPQFNEKYILKNNKYGYKIDIFHENLIFIPKAIKKEFQIYTPFSDAQRKAMENIIIKEWRKREGI